jgi:DNA (cytosine-5)-methyltransferase 1
MSAGVDVHCLASAGFSIRAVLEYRPQERRDKQDLTETGALNILANSKPSLLFNQDISKVDWSGVQQSLNNYEPVSLLHISLQCDDFSNAKTSGLKQRSLDNLDTSADLVYDALRMTETVRPGIVMVENVQGFMGSESGDLLRTKLRKWGYHVHEAVLDARQHGGLTSRKRYYLVASVWPDFQMPQPIEPRNDLWQVITQSLHECRDVSHTKTVHDGIAVGRDRIITKNSPFAPTVLKSQNRQAKDSIYIEHEGKYLMPSETLLRKLNSIPDSFDLQSCSQTISSEIVGQSIEYPMHHALSKAVYNHIRSNTLGTIMHISK